MNFIKIQNPITSLVLILFVALSITSCANESTPEVTEEEAVEIIETSLKRETSGVTETTETYSEELVTDISLNEICATEYTRNIPFSYNGAIIQANYNIDWTYSMVCNNLNIPQSANLNVNASGTFTTPRISSQDVINAQLSIPGIQPTSPTLNFGGTFVRQGMLAVTLRGNTKNLDSNLAFDLESVVVNKSDYEIASGNGSYVLSGNLEGTSYFFEGTIVYNGDQTATITVNGNSYTVDLS